MQAYDGSDAMSCSAGSLERIVICLASGCAAVLSVSKNTEYEYVKNVIENGIDKAIPEEISRWYKKHSHSPYRFTIQTEQEREDDLRKTLLGLFPGEEERIEKYIKSHTIGFEDDVFDYPPEATEANVGFMNSIYRNDIPPIQPKVSRVKKPLSKKTPTLSTKKPMTRKVGNNVRNTGLNGVTRNGVTKNNVTRNGTTRKRVKKSKPKPRTRKPLGIAI
jgi:hypothetical protein